MAFRKASLLLYFLFFLHILLGSTIRLASADLSHDNLPVQSVESKPDGDAFADKTAELAIVVKKGAGGGGGRGGGGRSFGGGGRSFGGGGRGGRGGGDGERSNRGRGVVPFVGGAGGSHHGGHRSSGDRKSASVWLGLSTLLGFVLGFYNFLI